MVYVHATHVAEWEAREAARAQQEAFAALVESAGPVGLADDAAAHEAHAQALGLTLDEYYAAEQATLERAVVVKRKPDG